jgi:hypothetical protein
LSTTSIGGWNTHSRHWAFASEFATASVISSRKLKFRCVLVLNLLRTEHRLNLMQVQFLVLVIRLRRLPARALLGRVMVAMVALFLVMVAMVSQVVLVVMLD